MKAPTRVFLATMWLLLWQLWLAPALAVSLFGQTLHTLDAIEERTELLTIDANQQWNFRIGDPTSNRRRETAYSSSQIVRWGSWPGILREQAVWLADGSWLCGDVQIEGERVTVTNDWLQTPPLAIKAVRGLVLSPPATRSRWLELQAGMLAAAGELDSVWIDGGKNLSGILRWPVSEADGGASTLAIDTSGQTLELSLEQIDAIVFSPTLVGPLPTHTHTTQLGLIDGTLLYATQIQATQIQTSQPSVAITLADSFKLTSLDAPHDFAEAIALVAGPPPQSQYLSQRTPASYRHLSDSTLSWTLGSDRDTRGLPLHTQQGIFDYGLATHSSSQVAYRWDGSAARLLAEVTLAAPLPQAAPGLGSVDCQVLLARNGQLETVHRFSLRRLATDQSPAVEIIDIDLSNAKLVVLVTDKSDYGQYGDQVLWLDARVTKGVRPL